MKKFSYAVRSKDGRTMTGVMEMESKDDVIRRLKQQQYFITSIKEVPKSTLSAIFEPRGKVKAKHMAILCRQFAIELQSGMSIIASLELLEDQSSEPRLKKALQQIRLDLSAGLSLTRALEKHRAVFPSVFVHLVEAGESAGALPEVLDRLAIYYEREDELRKKIGEALMYPGIIFTVAFIMVLLLIFIVLPMLIRNFAGFGVEPPVLTQRILAGRDWMVQHWYLVLGILFVIFHAIRAYLRTVRGRRQLHWVLLKGPVIGTLQQMIVYSRFCRTLALLLNSGVSMVESLQIVQRVVSNVVVQEALMEARAGVSRGDGLSQPLKASPVFPLMLTQMVAVGEETGNLEHTLAQLSDFYDREVNYAVASFTKLLEPIVMIVLAVVVLFILISVYLPMMQMVTQI